MILANHGIVSSSGGVLYDADALAFMTAASITDNTQKTAINTLVTDLKSYNIWTKMKAVYPFVGGTAAQHKFNLKDPRDLDAAFRLQFANGWVHSSTGAKPNGVDGFAYTFIVPSVVQSLNSNGMGMYLGTLNTSSSSDPVHMGVFNNSTQTSTLSINKANTNVTSRLNGSVINSSTITGTGFFSSQKTNATTTTIYKGSTSIGSGNSGGNLPIVQIALGNISADPSTFFVYGSGWTDSELRLSYVSEGLDSTEISNLYAVINTYQVALSRNV